MAAALRNCRHVKRPHISRVILLLCLASLACLPQIRASDDDSDGNIFDVVDYGAAGDGQEDDSQAFADAWKAACESDGSMTQLTVPQDKTFLVGPSTFSGPCKSDNVYVEVLGDIIAPATKSAWDDKDKDSWLLFESVQGLVINGTGTIDGQGSTWWGDSCSSCDGDTPMALKIKECDGVSLNGLTIVNGQKFHVFMQSDNAYVSNLHISSPEDSPNTDGIHVQDAANVIIHNCDIKSGDDCVSIASDSFNVSVTEISCGPGHGISIGSLGKDQSEAMVDRVHVKNAFFTGTTNGVRIKTWQGGRGYATNIAFEGLTFDNVTNPIIIDQFYCDSDDACKNKTSAVNVSSVSYTDATGSSASDVAINLSCSESLGCTDIRFSNVNLTTMDGDSASSLCYNADATIQGTVEPKLPCSSSG